MKKLLSILFCALILIFSTKDIRTYVAFKLNQDFITNNWCVNINKPATDCSGKCFLKKEWKENQEDKNDNSQLPQLEENIKNYYYAELKLLQLKDNDQIANNNFRHYYLVDQLFYPKLLDPPKTRFIS